MKERLEQLELENKQAQESMSFKDNELEVRFCNGIVSNTLFRLLIGGWFFFLLLFKWSNKVTYTLYNGFWTIELQQFMLGELFNETIMSKKIQLL